MTKIPIVDENDKLIEYKERDTLDHTKDVYRVSALWIINSKGDVLLAKRVATKTQDPNRWGLQYQALLRKKNHTNKT